MKSLLQVIQLFVTVISAPELISIYYVAVNMDNNPQTTLSSINMAGDQFGCITSLASPKLLLFGL